MNRAGRLAAADAIAIVLFAAIGQLSHHGGVSLAGFAHDALPILAGWFAAAAVFGAYRPPGKRAFLLTWLCGVTAGVALRALVLGRSINGHQLAFLIVALGFTLLLVLGCRALISRRALTSRA
ncbi:MAG TPA: DUF3054 domain-containing protein [Thermoleophilaceae bacterium]